MPEIGKWEPIETAPKDGTRIIAFDDDNWEPVFVYWDSGWWWESVSGSGYFGELTHWMPAPEAPERR